VPCHSASQLHVALRAGRNLELVLAHDGLEAPVVQQAQECSSLIGIRVETALRVPAELALTPTAVCRGECQQCAAGPHQDLRLHCSKAVHEATRRGLWQDEGVVQEF